MYLYSKIGNKQNAILMYPSAIKASFALTDVCAIEQTLFF